MRGLVLWGIVKKYGKRSFLTSQPILVGLLPEIDEQSSLRVAVIRSSITGLLSGLENCTLIILWVGERMHWLTIEADRLGPTLCGRLGKSRW